MTINIPKIKYLDSGNFFLMAGPCVVENKTMALDIGKRINDICDRLEIPFIFKASYKKANRSRIDSFTGIGDIVGLEAIQQVGEELNIPVVN